LRLAGDLIDETDERGDAVVGDTLLVLMNSHHEPVTFTLPATKTDQRWDLVVDTGTDASHGPADGRHALGGRATAIFRTWPAANTAPVEIGWAIP
jgi:glycogen operon protein